MFGFLFKLILTVVIVGGLAGFAYQRFSSSAPVVSDFSALLGQVKQLDTGSVAAQLSYQLDKLITHTDRSPMVMGIDITNKSLEAMVDTITSLPPQDLELVRGLICQPASPSAQ